MKVWVVWTGYEDVGGVFSTREKSEAFIKKHIKDNTGVIFKRSREEYSNIEMTLDVPKEDD